MTHLLRRLLVVCDEDGDPTALVHRYLADGYEVDTARGVDAACAILPQREFLVMVADLSAANDAALTVVHAAHACQPAPRVLLLLPRVSFDAPMALALMHEGAYVYLRHPIDLEELDELIATACAEEARARLGAPHTASVRRMRAIGGWKRAQDALSVALVGLAELGSLATPELMSEVADEVGRRLRAEGNPGLDVRSIELIARALGSRTERVLLARRAA